MIAIVALLAASLVWRKLEGGLLADSVTGAVILVALVLMAVRLRRER